MNKNDLEIVKCALLQAKSAEMASVVPDSMIEYNFSEKFEKEMNALIGKMRQKTIGFNKRTIAILIAAVILVSLLFTLAVAGEELYNFFIEISEKGTHFFTPQNTENPQVIENSYCPSYIPQGYYTDDSFVDRHMLSYTFKNDDSQIVFSQMVDNNIGHSINTEHEEYQIISILDCEVFYVFVENQNAYDFVWHNNGYLFTLTCINFIDFEEAVKIIESVEEK